ncbi:hypothetical protein BDL97_11G032300 [Sphagnum fallax]|nr:hypothetical protein BDL97_11G032300 [Sphagnum fallax]
MVIKESNVGTLVGKARKGKTFVVEEEKQVCRFVLHVSQDLITRNGQKNQHLARSLEIKWGLIKHDVAKFFALNESGTSSEDTLQKVLELFNSKHPKQNAFAFIHCWLILKDVLRWSKTKKETQVKSTTNMATITLKKTQIMENQNVLPLFMILEEQMLNFKAQKYLKLRHQEELEKQCHRL